MHGFKVELKTFLGLAMPNQCCHAVTKLILGCFVGEIFWQETPNLSDPYKQYYTILYDTYIHVDKGGFSHDPNCSQ